MEILSAKGVPHKGNWISPLIRNGVNVCRVNIARNTLALFILLAKNNAKIEVTNSQILQAVFVSIILIIVIIIVINTTCQTCFILKAHT